MWVVLKEVGRTKAGLDLDAFVGLVLVVAGGGRCAPYRFCWFTFQEIRRDSTHELGRSRCVVATRRSCHQGAVTRPPKIGETNEVAPDANVSTVANAGCMLHVHEIDTSTLDGGLTQSCRHPGTRCIQRLSATSPISRGILDRRRLHRASELW